ncbi:MAG: hypothetical protein ACR2J8_01515 [Thermomicrobiales bacterium]
MNDLLNFSWAALTDSTADPDLMGTIWELCAKHPDHPICAIARRGDGGSHPGAAHAGHAHAAAGGDGVWDNPLDGNGNGGSGNGGNIGWFPFS